jgi:protoporphyrinogen/coproporphyrinogen III oxidase
VRWGGGLPQPAPGHLGLVSSVRAALASAPTLALAGAAYDGVGVPACIGSGRAAARSVRAALAAAGTLGA